MKLIKYDTLILLVIFAMLWMFACSNQHNIAQSQPEGDRLIFLSDLVSYQAEAQGDSTEPTFSGFIEWIQEAPTDSCSLQVITTPKVKCISVHDVTLPTNEAVAIAWRGQSVSWITNSQVQGDKITILTDLIDNHITYDSLIVIDHSTIVSGSVTLNFAMCFTNSTGNWHNKLGDDIVFQTPKKRLAIWKQKENSISLPSQATSNEWSGLLSYARGWEAIWLFSSQLDSTSLESVWDAALGNDCKKTGKIDARGHEISQDHLDQFAHRMMEIKQ